MGLALGISVPNKNQSAGGDSKKKNKERPVHCQRIGSNSERKILIDPKDE